MKQRSDTHRKGILPVRPTEGKRPRRSNLASRYGIGIIFVAICIIFTVWTKGLFIQPLNIVNVLRQISINAIIATGMTLVIISAGIDLSVGSVAALVGVFTAHLLHLSGMPVAAVMAIALAGGVALGALCGAVNGFSITRFNVPPFISTLALMTAASGVAFIICGGRPVWNLPAEFNVLGRGYVLERMIGPWFPIPVLIMAAIMAGAHLLLTRTTIGRYIYAVGGNEEAARLSGIDVGWIKMFVYIISGTTAACGGILLASRLSSGQPNAGVSYELYAIAATVVGGTGLSGGEGTIPGTLIGALIIGALSNGMNLAGVESYLQKVILGVIILGAVMFDQAREKIK